MIRLGNWLVHRPGVQAQRGALEIAEIGVGLSSWGNQLKFWISWRLKVHDLINNKKY